MCPKWRWWWPFHLYEFYGTEWSPGRSEFLYVFQCVRCLAKVSR